MSYIFISHSSKNDFEAIALQSWLIKQGWDQLFLDLDPERGIVAGERWERALHDAASRCDAVLFMVSQQWIDSEWCRKEFRLAHRLNKRITGILIEDIDIATLPDELTATWQLVNLASGSDHELFRTTHPNTGIEQHIHFSNAGLTRLKTGLVKAGLDPQFFEWPPKHDLNRPPYRGMQPLEADDAGIFFGREAPTIELLAKLRGLREAPSPRFMVILGASGAGKSSFLRAGILPRLSRDERHFITLPIIRPERGALWGDNGLLQTINNTFSQKGLRISRSALRKALSSEPDKLIPLLQQLIDKATLPNLEGEAQNTTPTLVLSIDQGEELFQSETQEESEDFLTVLHTLATHNELPLIILFTIRSDSYEKLQVAKHLEGITQQTFSLAPMPQGSYQGVIEKPAERLANTDFPLQVEAALTHKLLEDIEKGGSKDALPLLAFTLEWLFLEFGGDGKLTLEDYQELGGIEGAIEEAVENVLDAAARDPELPSDYNALTTLLRRGLIPWLAGIDPQTQAPHRRIAKLHEIPEESRPIIRHLIEQRLLSTDVDKETNEVTIEPAHEALLRQWGLLKKWLKEDFAALTILESVQRASRDWEANNRSSDWLSHTAGRLEDAEQTLLQHVFVQVFTTSDHSYLEACRSKAEEIKNKEKKYISELEKERNNAKEELQNANHNLGLILAEKAQQAFSERLFDRAAYYAAHSYLKMKPDENRMINDWVWLTATNHFSIAWVNQVKNDQLGNYDSISISKNNTIGACGFVNTSEIFIFDCKENKLIYTLNRDNHDAYRLLVSPDGSKLLSWHEQGLNLWDLHTGQFISEVTDTNYEETKITIFCPNSKYFVTGDGISEDVRIWNTVKPCPWGGLSATLTKVLKPSNRDHTLIDDSNKNKPEGESRLLSLSYSYDGSVIVSVNSGGTINVWEVETENLISVFNISLPISDFIEIQFLSNTNDFVTFNDGSIRFWNTKNGELPRKINTEREIYKFLLSPDGKTCAFLTREDMSEDQLNFYHFDAPQEIEIPVLSYSTYTFLYSQDGKHIIWIKDESVSIFDIQSLQVLMRFNLQHWNTPETPYDRQSVIFYCAGLLQNWHLKVNHILALSWFSSFQYSNDGRLLACRTSSAELIVYDAVNQTRKLHIEQPFKGYVGNTLFSHDSTKLLSFEDVSFRRWDISSKKAILLDEVKFDMTIVNVISPDHKFLLFNNDNGSLNIYELETKKVIKILENKEQGFEQCIFSPDGNTFASMSLNGSLQIWDASSFEQLKSIEIFSINREKIKEASLADRFDLVADIPKVTSICYSQNRELFAYGDSFGSLTVLDTSCWEKIANPSPYNERIEIIKFCNNSSQIIAASIEGTIAILDSRTGLLLRSMKAHSAEIIEIQISEHHKLLLTLDKDGSLCIHELEELKLLTRLGNNSNRISAFALTPDNSSVAISDGQSISIIKITRILELKNGAGYKYWLDDFESKLGFSMEHLEATQSPTYQNKEESIFQWNQETLPNSTVKDSQDDTSGW